MSVHDDTVVMVKHLDWWNRRVTQLRAHFSAGWQRLELTALPIIQCSMGAGISWYVARNLVHHASPFFAPIAAVVSLGVSMGSRWRRVVELICGVMLGIVIGDILVKLVGHGVWQTAFVVAAAMVAATFIDRGLIFPIQAATSALLVVLFPPVEGAVSLGGPSRLVDAMIGGFIGVVISAFVPTRPFSHARRAAATTLQICESILRGVAEGLATRDSEKLEAVLAQARSSQSHIDTLRTFISAGDDIVHFSPLFWGHRHRVEAITSAAEHIDRIVRDLRVLARRAWILVNSGGKLGSGLLEALEATANASAEVRLLWLEKNITEERRQQVLKSLESCAQLLDPTMLSGVALSAEVVFAQLESTIFDLFQAAGFDQAVALNALRES